MSTSAGIVLPAKYIVYAHTLFAFAAFSSALVLGCYLHYYKIVENANFGYPDEYFPSVSATIGDRYPERLLFQLCVALASGPRILLLLFNYVAASPFSRSNLPLFTLVVGLLRTLTCGGWVYITLTDDHDTHDFFMIAYILLTLPWVIGTTIASPKNSLLKRGRCLTGLAFFLTLVPLVYWYVQHKVRVLPGAYSIYAFFEWLLIILDVSFDTWLAIALEPYSIVLRPQQMPFLSNSFERMTYEC